MKSKKIVSALLALVMVLTMLPMAAFAASSICTHESYTISNAGYQYTYYNTVYHKKAYVETFNCSDCSTSWSSSGSPVNEAHTIEVLYYVGDYEDSGETQYTYKVRCTVCNTRFDKDYPNKLW